jgi:hypothetical protein
LKKLGSSTSLFDHSQCGLSLTRLQPEKQRSGFLDVLLRTSIDGDLEGYRRGMISATDKSQSLR